MASATTTMMLLQSSSQAVVKSRDRPCAGLVHWFALCLGEKRTTVSAISKPERNATLNLSFNISQPPTSPEARRLHESSLVMSSLHHFLLYFVLSSTISRVKVPSMSFLARCVIPNLHSCPNLVFGICKEKTTSPNPTLRPGAFR